MIYFSKIFQLKGLKPKNKDHTNFYECCDLTEKVYLVALVPFLKPPVLFRSSLNDVIIASSSRLRRPLSPIRGWLHLPMTFWNKIFWVKKLKKVNAKNSWNQFLEKIFGPKSIFCNFKNGKKSIFELRKSLKLPKMQFHEKKNWFIWFHEFFCLDFFIFSGLLWIDDFSKSKKLQGKNSWN